MTQRFLVMYGHTADPTGSTFAWGGVSPDLPGCVSVGETLDEMRAVMKEALQGHLQIMADDGEPLSLPSATTIDFAQETPENGVDCCLVEYLEVQLPTGAVLAPGSGFMVPQTATPPPPMSVNNQGHHG